MQKLRKGMALLLAVLLCVGVLPLSGVAHAESLPEETTLEETSQKEETTVEEATPVVAESVAPEAASSDDDKEATKDNSAVSGEGESEDKESESEDEPVALSDKVLTATVDGIFVTISGKLPENAEIQAVSVPLNLAQEMLDTLDGRENDEEVREAVFALDVSILSDGEKFQPSDFGESVIVTIHNANAEDEPLELLHVKEDVTDGTGSLDVNAMQAAVDAAANGTVETETLATTESGNAVSFNMDSFSLLIASAPRRTPTSQANNVETWGELVAAINAIPAGGTGEIIITADFDLTGNITINGGKTVTIKTDGAQRTLTALAQNYAITISGSGTDVTLENLGLKNGAPLTINTQASATINNCTISDKTGVNGGGISARDSIVTIKDSIIKDNRSTNGSGGGGIYAYRSNVTIDNTSIINNTADPNHGGGIYVYGTQGVNQPVTITNSIVSGNQAKGNGGGIFARYVNLTVNGTRVTDNKTEVGDGGGIYVFNGTFQIKDTTINNNETARDGGVYLDYSASGSIEGGEINENTAQSNGGGIYAGSNVVVSIKDNAKVNSNTAQSYGGGIYAMSTASVSVTDSQINHNAATDGGGGVRNAGRLIVKNSKINENTTDYYGAGVCNNGTFRMEDSEICKNEAKESYGYGGGIYHYGARSALELISGEIAENSAARYGGGIYSHTGTTATMKNAAVYDNTAEWQGGGIWACPTGNTQIYVTQGIATFDNTAKEAGNDLVMTQPNDENADPFAYASSRMLGGFLNQYVEDGGLTDGTFNPQSTAPRLTDVDVPRSGDEWTDYDRQIEVAEGSVVLKNDVSPDAKDHAKKYAKLLIHDNTAGRDGGGIATNGALTIGENDVTELTVEKKWEGGDPANKAEFTLHQVDAEENDVTLNDEAIVTAADEWKYTAENLPTTYLDADGNEQNFTYYFEEVSIPGWEAATEVSDDGKTYTITNTRKTFDLSGTKTWIDGGKKHDNADEVTLTLTRISAAEGAVAETLEDVVPEWDGNQYTYKKLETHDPNGNEYTYTVTEASVNGYTSTIEGYNITNRITGTVTISATKVWSDGDDQDGIRPEAVTVKILAGGTDTGKTLTLSEANGWADSAELDKYDDDGKEITYTLEEVSVEGYESVISGNVEDGFTVTNSHTPREEPPVEPEKINISVKKVWDDENDKDGIRPDHVTIHLLANGEKAETITLNKDNGWEYTFAGLVKTDGDGKEITYTVTEDAIKEYDSKITGDAASGYVVTNKHTPKPDKPTKPENPKPDAPKNTNVPRTGDDTNLALWFSLMGVALAGLAATAFTTRRRRGGKQSK